VHLSDVSKETADRPSDTTSQKEKMHAHSNKGPCQPRNLYLTNKERPAPLKGKLREPRKVKEEIALQ